MLSVDPDDRPTEHLDCVSRKTPAEQRRFASVVSPSTASTRLDPRCAHELTLPLPRAQRLSASRAHGSSPVLQVAAVPLLTVRDVRSASGPQGAAPDRLKNSDSRRRARAVQTSSVVTCSTEGYSEQTRRLRWPSECAAHRLWRLSPGWLDGQLDDERGLRRATPGAAQLEPHALVPRL